MPGNRKSLNISMEAYESLTEAIEPYEDESATEYVLRVAETIVESDEHTDVTVYDTGEVALTAEEFHERMDAIEARIKEHDDTMPERTAGKVDETIEERQGHYR